MNKIDVFNEKYSFDSRQKESQKILLKYPSRIPIIVEKCKGCTLNDIDKIKYLVPKDMYISQFVFVIKYNFHNLHIQSLLIFIYTITI